MSQQFATQLQSGVGFTLHWGHLKQVPRIKSFINHPVNILILTYDYASKSRNLHYFTVMQLLHPVKDTAYTVSKKNNLQI